MPCDQYLASCSSSVVFSENRLVLVTTKLIFLLLKFIVPKYEVLCY